MIFFKNKKQNKNNKKNISSNKNIKKIYFEYKLDNELNCFNLSSYIDVQIVANTLITNGEVMVDLNSLEKSERIRVLDFLSGIIYFTKGYVKINENKKYYFCLE